MLDHVTIKNFRCLRDVSVPLKPLTVLIGENDTGKSTFLDAVDLLGRTHHSLAPLDHWDEDFRNAVGVRFAGSGVYQGLHVVPELKDRNGLPRRGPVDPSPPSLQRLSQATQYRLRSDGPGDDGEEPGLRFVSRLSVAADRVRFSGEQLTPPKSQEEQFEAISRFLTRHPVEQDGSNVPGILDQLLRTERASFLRIEARLRELVPGAESLSLTLPEAGRIGLSVRHDNGVTVPSDRLSAGVRALILYLTLAHRPDAPDIVLVEEPENGLHPKRLGEVMGLLRLLTEEKPGGRRTQVILTTHSPYLLDHVDLETDQVLVFRRGEDGARTAEPIDAAGLKTYLRDFMLGEIWDSVGERGLIEPENIDAEAPESEAPESEELESEDPETETARASAPAEPAGTSVAEQVGAAA